jgi:hypothetical protein
MGGSRINGAKGRIYVKVKIFSRLWSDDRSVLEREINEFLGTLPASAVRHVNTASASIEKDHEVRVETVVTVWYLETAVAIAERASNDDAEDQPELLAFSETLKNA